MKITEKNVKTSRYIYIYIECRSIRIFEILIANVTFYDYFIFSYLFIYHDLTMQTQIRNDSSQASAISRTNNYIQILFFFFFFFIESIVSTNQPFALRLPSMLQPFIQSLLRLPCCRAKLALIKQCLLRRIPLQIDSKTEEDT